MTAFQLHRGVAVSASTAPDMRTELAEVSLRRVFTSNCRPGSACVDVEDAPVKDIPPQYNTSLSEYSVAVLGSIALAATAWSVT